MNLAQTIFVASIVIGVLMLTWVGNEVCRALLRWSGLISAMKNKPASTASTLALPAAPKELPAHPAKTHPRVGHLIGSFERLLIAGAVLTGSWEILAAVIALKTVARFKELDEKLDAEYFLVGSLFSIVWAVMVTYGWMAYDHYWGCGLLSDLRSSK